MEIKELKSYIVDNDKVLPILESLECQHIKYHSNGYWTFGNPPPSDNPTAVTLYKDLGVVNYTKELSKPSDLITLIEFYKGINFFHALKWLHEFLGLDPNAEHDPNVPESIRITKMLLGMKNGKTEEDQGVIKILPEIMLSYYHIPIVNDMFAKDGIDYPTQVEFELGYCDTSNRIVIPVRTNTGELCGFKGRLMKEVLDPQEQKYLYLEPCPKSHLLFNIHRSYDYIKKKGLCFIGESEKFTMQLWSAGIYNSVAIGGHEFSKRQVESLYRLGVELVIAFDKDITEKQIIKECDKFLPGIKINYLLDKDGLMKDKSSPSDDMGVFKELCKNYMFVYERNE
jgi:DNA primase